MPLLAGNHAAGDEPGAAATVMVATDLAARGLDFPGSIDHVINFDMPGNAIDYLHRWELLHGSVCRCYRRLSASHIYMFLCYFVLVQPMLSQISAES